MVHFKSKYYICIQILNLNLNVNVPCPHHWSQISKDDDNTMEDTMVDSVGESTNLANVIQMLHSKKTPTQTQRTYSSHLVNLHRTREGPVNASFQQLNSTQMWTSALPLGNHAAHLAGPSLRGVGCT